MYPVRIQIQTCDQTFPHGLLVDSKTNFDDAETGDNRIYDCSNVVISLMISVVLNMSVCWRFYDLGYGLSY